MRIGQTINYRYRIKIFFLSLDCIFLISHSIKKFRSLFFRCAKIQWQYFNDWTHSGKKRKKIGNVIGFGCLLLYVYICFANYKSYRFYGTNGRISRRASKRTNECAAVDVVVVVLIVFDLSIRCVNGLILLSVNTINNGHSN